MASAVKKVLVVDVGGTHVKILATGQDQRTRRWSPAPRSRPKRWSMA